MLINWALSLSPTRFFMTQRQTFKLLPNRRVGIDAIAADSAIRFGRHTHDQFGIGLMERGGHKSSSGRGAVEAWPGDIITVNPGEVHDGAPIGQAGRAWRMLYVEPSIVAEISLDISGDRCGHTEFTRPVVRDKPLAFRFRQLFDSMAGAAPGRLKLDEGLVLLLAPLVRPGRINRAESPGVPSAMQSARAMIDDDPAAAVSLADLAQEAGLSRYQFLRRFAQLTGLTPHAYLVQRRVQLARRLIRKGTKSAEAAATAGFADQSHMTRAFVRTFGLTPGACASSST